MRALGLGLPSVARVQVSMNLTELEHTGLELACVTARELIEVRGGRIRRVELVGLVPAAALESASAEFLWWSGIDETVTIESRMAARGAGGHGGAGEGSAGATPGAGPVPLA